MHTNYFASIKKVIAAYPVYLLCLLFPFMAAIISRCSILDPIKFIAVQAAFVYLPGYAIQRLTKINYQNRLIRVLVSYATGYSISIIVYLALLMTSTQNLTLYVFLMLSLAAVGVLFFSRFSIDDGGFKEKEYKWFTITLLLSLAFSCVIFQCGNLNPLLRDGNVYCNQDVIFWMRNAIAATKRYPLPEMSVAGLDFYYHYFTSVHIAFLHLTTGIELYDLCFVYSYLITVFILVSGLFVVCRILMPQIKHVFITMFFVLFTVNVDSLTHVYFNHHLFLVSFGFAEGLGVFCMTFYYYIRMLQGEGKQWVLLLMVMLFLFTTTGLKGPLAAVLLVGIATGSLILMFKKGRVVYGLVTGIALLIAFLIPMLLFVLNIHSESVGRSAVLSLSATDTMYHPHYFERVNEFLTEIGLWLPLSYMVVFCIYLTLTFLVPFMVLVCVFKKRKPTDEELMIIIMVLVGIALGMFVSQSGMSQVYFLLISIVLVFFLAFSWLQDRELTIKTRNKLIGVFVLGFMLFCIHYAKPLAISTRNFASSTSLGRTVLHQIGLDKTKSENGFTINKKEMGGLRWMRDNLPNNAIVLSNKVLCEKGGARSFWVSSLTERQAFFEAYDYSNVNQDKIEENCKMIEDFYNGDENTCEQFRKMGVTHAIIFRNLSPHTYPMVCNKIFENSDIIIVEI